MPLSKRIKNNKMDLFMHLASRTVCLTLALIVGFSAAAEAKGKKARPSSSAMAVSSAQTTLYSLGYYAGKVNGVMDKATKAALVKFQTDNNIPASGSLTGETVQMLKQGDQYVSMYSPAPAAGAAPYSPPLTKGAARETSVKPRHIVWSHVVPNRFANVTINAIKKGDYTVSINGMPVLVANRQPAPLGVSQTYHLPNEDAVIFTSYDGNGGCNYKNYLVSVRSDGTVTAPREVGNCSGGYQASVQNGTLVVGFPKGTYTTSSAMWDTWHYTNQNLAHL